jgi:hypothetical protein
MGFEDIGDREGRGAEGRGAEDRGAEGRGAEDRGAVVGPRIARIAARKIAARWWDRELRGSRLGRSRGRRSHGRDGGRPGRVTGPARDRSGLATHRQVRRAGPGMGGRKGHRGRPPQLSARRDPLPLRSRGPAELPGRGHLTAGFRRRQLAEAWATTQPPLASARCGCVRICLLRSQWARHPIFQVGPVLLRGRQQPPLASARCGCVRTCLLRC